MSCETAMALAGTESFLIINETAVGRDTVLTRIFQKGEIRAFCQVLSEITHPQQR
jgi:hypothetical protein